MSLKLKALEDLKSWASDARQKLMPLPPSVYTSPELLELEIERIFRREWVCVGHVSEFGKTGDFRTFDLAGTPLLIVRDEEGTIRAFANVCRHRSAILTSGEGCRKLFTCPYHAWTYNTSGRLTAAPYMDAADVEGVKLEEYRLEVWEGLVFVNLDADAAPLSDGLAGLKERYGPYNMADYKVVLREEAEAECDWKVLVENFCESYHVFCVHPKTLEPNFPTDTTRVLDGGEGYNLHSMQLGIEAKFNDPKAVERIPEATRRIGYLSAIYPSTTLGVDPAHMVWLSVRPTGPQKIKYTAFGAVHKDLAEESAKRWPEDIAAFMAEDRVTIERVQKGLVAQVATAGILHPWEKTNWEFGHYLARKLA